MLCYCLIPVWDIGPQTSLSGYSSGFAGVITGMAAPSSIQVGYAQSAVEAFAS